MKHNLIFDEICRLCLRKDECISFIFNEFKFPDKISLAERIYKISSIKISVDDGLPSNICFACKKKVDEFYEFRTQIIETEEILHQCLSLNKSDYKTDSNDDDLQLVCVEEDGTQVFTLDNKFIDEKDSVVVLPISKDKQKSDCHNSNGVSDENSVVIFPKKSPCNKAIPLKFLNFINEKSEEKENLTNGNVDKPNDMKNEQDAINSNKTCEKKTENNRSVSKTKLNSLRMKKSLDENSCTVSCQLCLQQFAKYEELKQHISDHFDGFNHYEPLPDDADLEDLNRSICQYCLMRVDDVDSHIETEHANKIYICKHCSEQFENEQSFKEHLKTSHYTLQCNLCPKKFKTYLELQSHLSSSHYMGAFWCLPCSKAFTQKYDFILHQRRHLGIRPFRCKHCVKSFVTATLCKEHERRHTKDSTFLCKFCGKSYLRTSDVRNHERTVHMNDGPISCQVCNKLFSNMSSYKLHSKRHELGLRFVCNVCGKAYYSNSELQRHEQIHSGMRKYPCDICENSFLSQPELNRHLKYHTKEKKYRCAECGKCYYESGHLRIHERSHTGIKPFECTVCSKRFVSRPKLVRHSKTHEQIRSQTITTYQDSSTVVEDTTENVLNNGCTGDGEMPAEQQTKNNGEIDEYNKVMDMENVIIDDASNVFGIQMSDGNIVLMENGETLINDHDLIYTSIQDNIKIEIIDS